MTNHIELLREARDYLERMDHEDGMEDLNPGCEGCKLRAKINAALSESAKAGEVAPTYPLSLAEQSVMHRTLMRAAKESVAPQVAQEAGIISGSSGHLPAEPAPAADPARAALKMAAEVCRDHKLAGELSGWNSACRSLAAELDRLAGESEFVCVPREIDRDKHRPVLDVWNQCMQECATLEDTWPRLVEAMATAKGARS